MEIVDGKMIFEERERRDLERYLVFCFKCILIKSNCNFYINSFFFWEVSIWYTFLDYFEVTNSSLFCSVLR